MIDCTTRKIRAVAGSLCATGFNFVKKPAGRLGIFFILGAYIVGINTIVFSRTLAVMRQDCADKT
jgi:hypothetical protein